MRGGTHGHLRSGRRWPRHRGGLVGSAGRRREPGLRQRNGRGFAVLRWRRPGLGWSGVGRRRWHEGDHCGRQAGQERGRRQRRGRPGRSGWDVMRRLDWRITQTGRVPCIEQGGGALDQMVGLRCHNDAVALPDGCSETLLGFGVAQPSGGLAMPITGRCGHFSPPNRPCLWRRPSSASASSLGATARQSSHPFRRAATAIGIPATVWLRNATWRVLWNTVPRHHWSSVRQTFYDIQLNGPFATDSFSLSSPNLNQFGTWEPRARRTLHETSASFNLCCVTVVDIFGRA